jgi:hypothetical protein
MVELSQELRNRLISDGWRESNQPFWREEPCFYDLAVVKTVLLFRDIQGNVVDDDFFWKYESQTLPSYLDATEVIIRRYNLHHSMNALLWHDHGDRKIVH